MATDDSQEDTLAPSEPAAVLEVGTLFDHSYQIQSVLGRGALGIVYKAKQTTLNRIVALKLVHRHLTGVDVVKQALKQEAHTIAKLKHPNILHVYGFGIADEQAYLVSEYVEGMSLSRLLERKRLIIKDKAVSILTQICDALEHAHSAGVIHGDIKPSNVLMTGAEKQTVKLLDFGISQGLPAAGINLQSLNDTESIEGTIAYTSPEQCMGKRADARSDIYSLACVAYEIMTGHPPFTGAPYQTVQDHIHTPPQKTAELENNLGKVILWALAKEPTKRPQTAAAFKQALTDPDYYVKTELAGKAEKKSSAHGPLIWTAGSLIVAIVLGVVSFVNFAKPSDRVILIQTLEKQDVKSVLGLVEKTLPQETKTIDVTNSIIKSAEFKGWRLDKRIELLDALFEKFAQKGSVKETLLVAEQLYLELVAEGTVYDIKHSKPTRLWQNRLKKVCTYLIAHERSSYAWHQIFFITEIARVKKNRQLFQYLDDREAMLLFMELRAMACAKEAVEGIRGFGRSADIYAGAADKAWEFNMMPEYKKYLQKTTEICQTYKVPAEAYLHVLKAREYLSIKEKDKARSELSLVDKTIEEMSLDLDSFEARKKVLKAELAK